MIVTKYTTAIKQPEAPDCQPDTSKQASATSTNQSTQLIITVACLSFFPLMYIVGKAVVSLLAS